MADVWIGLGGNLGDVTNAFRQALSQLGQTALTDIRCSPIYGSSPVGPQDQPDFLNAVARANTALSPDELLSELLATEVALGRQRKRHWGERTLDLDLLLYDNEQIHTPRLTVPHPQLHHRAFVLVPMADLDQEQIVPGLGTSVASLLQQCNRDGVWYHGSLSG